MDCIEKETARREVPSAQHSSQLGVYIINKPEGVTVLGEVLADGLHFPAGQLIQIGEEGQHQLQRRKRPHRIPCIGTSIGYNHIRKSIAR